MVAPGKGILAADEITASIAKRLESINTPSTEESRRDYREMLFGATDAMKSYISGVILFDETLRQKAAQRHAAGRYDQGRRRRSRHQARHGCEAPGAFARRNRDRRPRRPRRPRCRICQARRRVRQVARRHRHRQASMPSHNAIHANAHALARYAAICQAGGIVPMVEPEVLMDGDHDIDTCCEVTEWVLKEQFQELYYAGVELEGIILKPNMVISGKKCAKQAGREEVAEKTLKVLKRCVPAAVPGIAFLSGGQSSEDATAHLHYMNAAGPLPWRLTFSYGRALQADALKAWGGKAENVAAGQRAFAHRAKMNALATSGKWSKALEKAA